MNTGSGADPGSDYILSLYTVAKKHVHLSIKQGIISLRTLVPFTGDFWTWQQRHMQGNTDTVSSVHVNPNPGK